MRLRVWAECLCPSSPDFVHARPPCAHVEVCLRVDVLLLPYLFPVGTQHLQAGTSGAC